MLNAFIYMFKDKDFFSKFFIYVFFVVLFGIFSLLLKMYIKTNLIIGSLFFIIVLFIFFILTGYLISCMQNIIKNKDGINLPCINHILDFKKGFKKSVAFSILILLIVLISLLLFIPGAILLFVPALIFSSIFLPAFYYIFARTENLLSFVMFKKAINLILEDDTRYIKAISCYILSMILTAILHSIALAKIYEYYSYKTAILAGESPEQINLVATALYFVFYIIAFSYSNFVNAYIFANCSEIDFEENKNPA